jgi:hypothetical protein
MTLSATREFRYFVYKLNDVIKYLSREQIEALADIARTIEQGRTAAGKEDFECVVVEKDWPEFDAIWKSIEGRSTDGELLP